MDYQSLKKPELLAPAGSFEKAKIAYMYGADAVYCGTPSLSLRSRSELGDDDLKKTIEYAHSLGKRVHTAINIYAFDEYYEEIKKQAKMLNDMKVDGIIVADGGVFNTLKEYAPDIDLHISTQANSVSLQDCMFWYKNGAKRIILARELSKKQIEKIMEGKPDDLEIEMFCHGAICFSYSGRCFLSQYLSDRSANLGDCSQSCRWAYNVYVEEAENPGKLMPVENDDNPASKGTHIFSSKDLCLIKEIPEIIKMGLDSVKIEGRLKTEYYLASVVNTYRCAIDEAYDLLQKGEIEKYDYQKYLDELEKTKTRGLTTFYFNDENNQDIQEYDGKQINLNYEFGAKIIENQDEYTLVEIRNKLSIGDEMEIIVPGEIEVKKFTINELVDSETHEKIDTINPGKQGQTVLMKIPYEIEKDWIIRRKK